MTFNSVVKICWKKIEEAFENMVPPSTIQTLADLSIAQFWMQKVGVLSSIARSRTNEPISNAYSTIVEYFANYESAVEKMLGDQPKPTYLTLVQGPIVYLERNTNPRAGNMVFPPRLLNEWVLDSFQRIPV